MRSKSIGVRHAGVGEVRDLQAEPGDRRARAYATRVAPRRHVRPGRYPRDVPEWPSAASTRLHARVARLATARADGGPHLVPICFALDGDTLYSAVDHKREAFARLQRLANIEADPRVCVLVDRLRSEDWSRLWWARADGLARIVERSTSPSTRARSSSCSIAIRSTGTRPRSARRSRSRSPAGRAGRREPRAAIQLGPRRQAAAPQREAGERLEHQVVAAIAVMLPLGS